MWVKYPYTIYPTHRGAEKWIKTVTFSHLHNNNLNLVYYGYFMILILNYSQLLSITEKYPPNILSDHKRPTKSI